MRDKAIGKSVELSTTAVYEPPRIHRVLRFRDLIRQGFPSPPPPPGGESEEPDFDEWDRYV